MRNSKICSEQIDMNDLLLKYGLITYLIGLVGGFIYMNLFVKKSDVNHRKIGIVEIAKHLSMCFIFYFLTTTFYVVTVGNRMQYIATIETNWLASVAMSIVCLINALFFFGLLNFNRQEINSFPFNENLMSTLKWWKTVILTIPFMWISLNSILLSLWVFQFNWSIVCSLIGMFTAIIFHGFNELNYQKNSYEHTARN